MTRPQFIVAMAVHIAGYGGLSAAQALPIAAEAYRAFEADNRVSFGDPAFAWDRDAAREVAHAYETAHW